MRRIALLGMLVAGVARADAPAWSQPVSAPVASAPVNHAPVAVHPDAPIIDSGHIHEGGPARGLFESDRAFPGFIGPISNPVLTKDPRSLTEARALFVHNTFPEANRVLGGGDAQIYGLEVRLALTDRLTFIADKDGYASINPRNLPDRTGWLNINVGFKYALVRDVENQFLVTLGATYEPTTGEAKVFQPTGSGIVTGFGVIGKEFGDWHVLVNGGYQCGVRANEHSSFAYTQLHIDRRICGWLYPLAELNAFYYTAGGRQFPTALGEGDGLLNFGTAGSAGNTLITAAVGMKAQVCPNLDVGVAYEMPLGRKDILLNRLLVEMIFRY